MRKLLAVLSSIFIFATFHTQSWMDLGLKGGYGTSILTNNNIWDDSDYNHQISGSYCFGGKIGLNFNENHEVTFDIMYNEFNQNFLYNFYDSITESSPLYKSSISYHSLSYILMYRHNKEGRYSEIGTSVETILKVNRKDEIDYFQGIAIAKNDFIANQANIVAGFGAYLLGSENFGVTTGIRISYGLKDLISLAGQNKSLPTFKNYESYNASHPLSIIFIIEANFDFAYVAKAQCSRRKLIFF